MTDYSEAGDEALRARIVDIAARAEVVDADGDDRVTRAVVIEFAGAMLDRIGSRSVEYTLTDTFTAPVGQLLTALPMVGIVEPGQADAYLTRLRLVPQALADLAERHRSGIAAGRLPVRRLVDSAVAYLDRYLSHVDSDPLRRPAVGDALEADRDRLLADVVRPAFAAYREVLAAEVAPHGRPDERSGLCWLPGGEASYANLVRVHTTTSRTAEELHRTGLETVAALAGEYAEIAGRVFGTRDLGETFTRLRTDPALRWTDGDELLAAARTAIARAEQVAPRWFGRLPRQRCTVEPVDV